MTVKQAAELYARLVRVSHDAIKSKDPKAEIVTAGFITQKDPYVYEFIDRFYSVPGIKDDFDAVGHHAYAPSLDKIRKAIKRVREVMAKHHDRATPLWLTELGWGSDSPDGEGINLGLEGQANMLNRSFKMILANRTAWNVQRIYWFDWRDPAEGSHYATICGRCGSAGLTTYERASKPSHDAFLAFTAETTPPLARRGRPSPAGSTPAGSRPAPPTTPRRSSPMVRTPFRPGRSTRPATKAPSSRARSRSTRSRRRLRGST
jgi:hypothetical protein